MAKPLRWSPSRLAPGIGGASLALILGITLLRGTIVGAGLLLGGGAGLAWILARLLSPWLGARRRWRVRYHAPALDAQVAATLGRSLDTLTRATERGIVMVWRREAGELTWLLDVPASGAAALERVLAHLLSDLIVEPIDTPPGVPSSRPADAKLYRWPLDRAGQGGPGDPLDATELIDTPVLAGDFELMVHIYTGGGSAVVHGQAGPAAAAVGLRPLWRFANHPWLRMLWRYYGFLIPWPGEGVPRTPPAIRVPTTGGRGTRRLDTQTSLHIPLPSGYVYPADAGAPVLGRSTLDGRVLASPSGAAGKPHFFILGQKRRSHPALVAMLLKQTLAAGGSVLHLDPTGTRGGVLAELVGYRRQAAWIDLENPGGSVRLNLLAVPAIGADPIRSEARALVLALEECVPVLESLLRLLSVRTGSGSAGTFFLDWARTCLLVHHRHRLAGVEAAPPPTLPLLYDALNDPEGLPRLVVQESGCWQTPDSRLAAAVAAAGLEGEAAAACARTTLAAIRGRLATQSESARRLLAATLRTSLGPVLDDLALRQLWSGAATPVTVLSAPGTLLLARLPRRDVVEADAVTARWAGYYLLTAALAVARIRVRQGQSGPPLLLVLEDVGEWVGGGLLQQALPVLGQAEIAVLMTSAQLPPEPGGTQLLHSAGTWWITALAPGDVAPMRAQLWEAESRDDWPLTILPVEMAICKTTTADGPLVATVYPDVEP